jgi:hypothetical protein
MTPLKGIVGSTIKAPQENADAVGTGKVYIEIDAGEYATVDL